MDLGWKGHKYSVHNTGYKAVQQIFKIQLLPQIWCKIKYILSMYFTGLTHLMLNLIKADIPNLWLILPLEPLKGRMSIIWEVGKLPFKRKFEVEEICNKNFTGTSWKTYHMDQNPKLSSSNHFNLVPFTGSLRKTDSIFTDILTLRLAVAV